MPPASVATTNHFDGSGDEGWGDASIELTPPPDQGCHCHCQGECECGCRSCASRMDIVLDEAYQLDYTRQGGSADIVPSQPVNIQDSRAYTADDADEYLTGLMNNSYEATSPSASLPLTGRNLERLARASSNTPEARHSVLTRGWLCDPHHEAPHPLIALDPGMKHDMPPGDMADDMSINESVFVEPGERSMAMSMVSEFSHSLTRSSPSASIYLSGMRPSYIYIHTPLPLVAECTHARNDRRCGCYCRM